MFQVVYISKCHFKCINVWHEPRVKCIMFCHWQLTGSKTAFSGSVVARLLNVADSIIEQMCHKDIHCHSAVLIYLEAYSFPSTTLIWHPLPSSFFKFLRHGISSAPYSYIYVSITDCKTNYRWLSSISSSERVVQWFSKGVLQVPLGVPWNLVVILLQAKENL